VGVMPSSMFTCCLAWGHFSDAYNFPTRSDGKLSAASARYAETGTVAFRS
jgi:hypothetical protein